MIDKLWRRKRCDVEYLLKMKYSMHQEKKKHSSKLVEEISQKTGGTFTATHATGVGVDSTYGAGRRGTTCASPGVAV